MPDAVSLDLPVSRFLADHPASRTVLAELGVAASADAEFMASAAPFLSMGSLLTLNGLSATLFLIGFNLSKQLSGVVLSAWVGRMYDTVGFHQAYLILGCFTLSFTVISLFTLKGSKTLLPAAA